MKIHAFFCSLLLTVIAGSACMAATAGKEEGNDLVISTSGKTSAIIVVSTSAGTNEKQAANDLAEVTGRHIRDHARGLKIALQRCIGRKGAHDEPIMPWLLRWAALSISRFKQGRDGRTPDERQKGRNRELEVVISSPGENHSKHSEQPKRMNSQLGCGGLASASSIRRPLRRRAAKFQIHKP